MLLIICPCQCHLMWLQTLIIKSVTIDASESLTIMLCHRDVYGNDPKMVWWWWWLTGVATPRRILTTPHTKHTHATYTLPKKKKYY